MRLNSIHLINRAPFGNLFIDLSKGEIAVLSGINGAGKTTILSYIAESFYELARIGFEFEFASKGNGFYRMSSSIYSMNNTKPSIVYLRFQKNNGSFADYIDIYGNCSEELYNILLPLHDKIAFSSFAKALEQNGVVKRWSVKDKKDICSLFEENVLTYFPAYRFEKPAYLIKPDEIDLEFNKEMIISGYLPNPLEVTSTLHTVANWIMDLVLDRRIYQGTASTLFDQLNIILSNILLEKTGCHTRLGIGPRNSGATRIAVMDRSNDEKQIYPSIFNMSSGELSLLCIFGELLKQSDKIGKDSTSVSGIVLIDEIDKHLHIKLQKDILPRLVALFPNIQFIVSSHSPFFGTGLEEKGELAYNIYDLDNGGRICYSGDLDLFKEIYSMMISENENYAHKYRELEKKINENTKPLIITEGKTDWKHILAAKKKLNILDLDIELYEFEDTLGDVALAQLLEAYSRIAQSRIIIGIFDRDNFEKLNIEGISSQEYVSFENNVFGLAIPVVNEEEYGTAISIEHFYKKKDLLKVDSNNRRLFLGTEFYKSGFGKSSSLHTRCKGIDKKVEINGIIDEKVYDITVDPEEQNSIALSKDDFACLMLNDNHFSEGVDFSEFNKIFDVIRKILIENTPNS